MKNLILLFINIISLISGSLPSAKLYKFKTNMQRFMRALFLVVILVFVINNTIAQKQILTHHVLIIDKTGSMIGKGDGNPEPIWEDAKKSIKNYVKNVDEGDYLSLYTFALVPSEAKTYKVTYSIREEIIKYIDNIEANGQYTAIYDAFYKAFEEAKGLIPEETKVNTNFYLYTDGIDNHSKKTFSGTIKEFSLNYDDSDYIFYKRLRENTQVPDEVQKVADTCPNVKIEKAGLKTKFLKINPIHKPLIFNFYGEQNKITSTQEFEVTGDAAFENTLGFSIRLDINYTGANFRIIEDEFSIDKRNKAVDVSIEIINGNINSEDTIEGKLKYNNLSVDLENTEIEFIPDTHDIRIISDPPKVKIKNGGWQ
ncbi:MAG: vWA domain-containing protein [bacterium]